MISTFYLLIFVSQTVILWKFSFPSLLIRPDRSLNDIGVLYWCIQFLVEISSGWKNFFICQITGKRVFKLNIVMIIKKIQKWPNFTGIIWNTLCWSSAFTMDQPLYNGSCVTHILSHVYQKIKNRFFDKHKILWKNSIQFIF